MMNNSSHAGDSELQIAYTVACSIGVLIASVLLISVLCARAFKTFLQRLFIVIILTKLCHDLLRVSSIHHDPEDDVRAIMCVLVALLLEWSHWCFYLFMTVAVILLFIIARVQSSANLAIVSRVRNSKCWRRMLEFFVVIGTLLAPWTVIWIPYVQKQYGFDGIICARIPSSKNRTLISDKAVNVLNNYVPRELLSLASGCSSIGIALVYCRLSAEMKQARHVIKKLAISTTAVFIYFVIIHLQLFDEYADNKIKLKIRIFYVYWHIVVIYLLLAGYLALFHSPNFHKQITKLRKKRSSDNPEKFERVNEYGTFRESTRETLPSSTFYNISHPQDFTTTVSKV